MPNQFKVGDIVRYTIRSLGPPFSNEDTVMKVRITRAPGYIETYWVVVLEILAGYPTYQVGEQLACDPSHISKL